jgi:hypothetical protein
LLFNTLDELHKLRTFTTKNLDDGHEDNEAYQEECGLLGCDAVSFGESPTFRWASVGSFPGLPLDSEDECDMFLTKLHGVTTLHSHCNEDLKSKQHKLFCLIRKRLFNFNEELLKTALVKNSYRQQLEKS